MSELIWVCDIKRNKARRPGQSTCCAGLWPYFPRRRVLFKLGKQDDGSLTETCFFRIQIPLSLAKLEGPRPNEEEDELTLWNLWRRGGYVGRRESARWLSVPPFLSTQCDLASAATTPLFLPTFPACLPACLHRPLARRCEAILVTKHYAGRGHSSPPPFPPWLSGRSQRSRPAAAGSLRPAGRNLLS